MTASLTAFAFALLVGQVAEDSQLNRAGERAAAAAESAERAALAAQAAAEASVRAIESLRASDGVAPPTASKDTEVQAAKKWTGTAGVALIALSGNSSTLTVTANLGAERNWENWILGLKGFALYGQSRSATGGPSEVVALGAGLQARGDRKANKWISFYLATGLETDHVKSVEYRASGEGGTAITWIDEKRDDGTQKRLLRTDLGLRYAREARFQYFPVATALPPADILGPKAGATFRYALSRDLFFHQDLEVIPSLLGPTRVLVNAQSKLSATLTETWAIGVSFLVNYDSAPAPAKVPTDTALTVGLDAKF
jgi:hypothetical protein